MVSELLASPPLVCSCLSLLLPLLPLLLLICAVKEMLLDSKINILMLCVPLGVAAHLAQWGATSVFLLVRCLGVEDSCLCA
jgi:hypothetical protein